MAELSMMIYPWDLQADTPERVVDEVAERGVTRLQIATAYHSAEVLAPRRTARVSTVAEANRAHLPLPADAFTGLSVRPSSIAQTDPDLYPRFKRAADAAGVAVDGWAIAFHNTDLATAHPEAAIENCFGDHFTHGLCPSSPAARTYAIELLDAAGKPRRDIFARVFNVDEVRLFGLLRAAIDDGSQNQKTSMILPEKAHVWDVREHEYLGFGDRFELSLDG